MEIDQRDLELSIDYCVTILQHGGVRSANWIMAEQNQNVTELPSSENTTLGM